MDVNYEMGLVLDEVLDLAMQDVPGEDINEGYGINGRKDANGDIGKTNTRQ